MEMYVIVKNQFQYNLSEKIVFDVKIDLLISKMNNYEVSL